MPRFAARVEIFSELRLLLPVQFTTDNPKEGTGLLLGVFQPRDPFESRILQACLCFGLRDIVEQRRLARTFHSG